MASAGPSNSILTVPALQIVFAFASLFIGFEFGLASRSKPPPSILDIPLAESVIEQAVAEDVALLEADEPESDEALMEPSDGDLADIVPGVWEPCKLVLVVRTDLKMSLGDIAAQCSDATLACYKVLQRKNAHLVRHWEVTGQAKIALKGNSEDQLLELEAIAKSLNLCARAVHNEELTKDKEGTRTVLAIGPAPVDLVNKATGKLRLL